MCWHKHQIKRQTDVSFGRATTPSGTSFRNLYLTLRHSETRSQQRYKRRKKLFGFLFQRPHNGVANQVLNALRCKISIFWTTNLYLIVNKPNREVLEMTGHQTQMEAFGLYLKIPIKRFGLHLFSLFQQALSIWSYGTKHRCQTAVRRRSYLKTVGFDFNRYITGQLSGSYNNQSKIGILYDLFLRHK